VVGHFTAMIWKGAKTMGCGTARKGSETMMVCRYRAGPKLGSDTPNFTTDSPANVGQQVKTLKECQGSAFLKEKGLLPQCKCKSGCLGPYGVSKNKICYTTGKCDGALPSPKGWWASTPACNPSMKTIKTSAQEKKYWTAKRKKGFKCHKYNRKTKKLQDQKPAWCKKRAAGYRAFCCNVYDNIKCGIMPMWRYCADTCQDYNEARCMKIKAGLPEGSGCRRRRRFTLKQSVRALKVKRLQTVNSRHK